MRKRLLDRAWKIPASLILLSLLGLSCAHYPLNARLLRYDHALGYRFDALDGGPDGDALFICLAFSGGGTRAAAFSYGVLSKLASVTVDWKGRTIRLLDEVDCISSVSGGSFTAAYYALHDDGIFKDFGEKFLYRNVQWDLTLKALNPVNWIRLASPYFSRIDLAAELYDRTVFDHHTYADLLVRRRRPFLIVNATHIEPGEQFPFTQDEFDWLGSDLSSLPLARAVAASSAFPVLLSPISLKNFPVPSGFSTPQVVSLALGDTYDNPRRQAWARGLLEYEDKAAHPYVHLMDGGLADNIGLRAIADEYRRGFIRDRTYGKIEKLVIITANARTEPPETIDDREAPPGLATVAYKTATVAMDRYSFDTVEMMRELSEERQKAQRSLRDCQEAIEERCPGGPKLTPLAGAFQSYVIELDFGQIKDPKERDCFLALPTSFALERTQVDALIDVAGELLDAHPRFQELLRDLGVKERPAPATTTHCRKP